MVFAQAKHKHLFGPRSGVLYLYTHPTTLGTTPAAAAWVWCTVARLARALSRAFAIKLRAEVDAERQETPD